MRLEVTLRARAIWLVGFGSRRRSIDAFGDVMEDVDDGGGLLQAHDGGVSVVCPLRSICPSSGSWSELALTAGLRGRPQAARDARRRRSSPTAPPIWKATRELWPDAIEQRCTVHALRNITSKLPDRLHRELKARYWAILDEATSAADAKAGLIR